MARAPRSRSAAARASGAGPDPLQFPAAVRIRAPGCRPSVSTAGEALLLIDNELPAELRRQPRWKFARALFEEVMRTSRKRDLTAAVRQLRQALSNEGWLVDTAPIRSSVSSRAP